jgi:hypothetical protein
LLASGVPASDPSYRRALFYLLACETSCSATGARASGRITAPSSPAALSVLAGTPVTCRDTLAGSTVPAGEPATALGVLRPALITTNATTIAITARMLPPVSSTRLRTCARLAAARSAAIRALALCCRVRTALLIYGCLPCTLPPVPAPASAPEPERRLLADAARNRQHPANLPAPGKLTRSATPERDHQGVDCGETVVRLVDTQDTGRRPPPACTESMQVQPAESMLNMCWQAASSGGQNLATTRMAWARLAAITYP